MRKQLKKIALVASIALALVFTLSCSAGDSEESNSLNSRDGKPVCSAILSGIGMCFEGGSLTEEACTAMGASTPVPTKWQENGSCPSGGKKCPKSYYGDGTGYAYGTYPCP